MATNKYFNLYHQKNEQTLVQQLVEEAVKIHGIDAVYIPRKEKNLDNIFREDVLSHFDDYHFLEVYVKNVDTFDGDQDIFKKFGLEIKNQITFSVSRSSFAKILGKEFIRPREGDLIYLPMSTATGLYEIKFVKEDSVFFTLGEFYIYDLQCELFAPSNENVNTGIKEIDRLGTKGENHVSLLIGEGLGNFFEDEVVYQGESAIGADAKGVVVSFDGTKLILKDVFGNFDKSLGLIHGTKAQAGGPASYVLLSDEEQTENDASSQDSAFNENAVIDFTEYNPFSEEDY